MQVNKQIGTVTLLADGENPLEIFEKLAMLQEVFCEDKCGKCGNTALSYRVRKVQDGKKEYTYPELGCNKCYAKLTFGQSDDGRLFPVRYQRKDKEYIKDKDGRNIPKGSNGWVKYNKETGKEE